MEKRVKQLTLSSNKFWGFLRTASSPLLEHICGCIRFFTAWKLVCKGCASSLLMDSSETPEYYMVLGPSFVHSDRSIVPAFGHPIHLKNFFIKTSFKPFLEIHPCKPRVGGFLVNSFYEVVYTFNLLDDF